MCVMAWYVCAKMEGWVGDGVVYVRTKGVSVYGGRSGFPALQTHVMVGFDEWVLTSS